MVGEDLRPSQILTREAFENAIRVVHAISGSTNAILHLLAFAGRVGVDLPLKLFDDLCATTPWLVDLKPAGRHLMEDFYYAGGMPAVMAQLGDLLHLDAPTVTGKTVAENIAGATIVDEEVIRPRARPLDDGGSLVVLYGSLCPDGAVMKTSAADPALLQHEGRALVFDNVHDLAARVDDPDLDVDASTVMVLRNAGPVGGPGMPEWGHLPIPAKLLRAGVTDLLRISDARMSGTSYGAVVLHVAPGVGRRRAARARARRRPDPPRRRRADARSRRRRGGARGPSRRVDAAAAEGRARLPRDVRRPRAAGERRAATSTSCAAARASSRTRSRTSSRPSHDRNPLARIPIAQTPEDARDAGAARPSHDRNPLARIPIAQTPEGAGLRGSRLLIPRGCRTADAVESVDGTRRRQGRRRSPAPRGGQGAAEAMALAAEGATVVATDLRPPRSSGRA